MNGIGGRTIAEAQERMSYDEFTRWVAYRNQRGSLHPGMRIEHGAALVSSILANVHSKNGGHKLTDFMPHADEPQVSLEEAMQSWE